MLYPIQINQQSEASGLHHTAGIKMRRYFFFVGWLVVFYELNVKKTSPTCPLIQTGGSIPYSHLKKERIHSNLAVLFPPQRKEAVDQRWKNLQKGLKQFS